MAEKIKIPQLLSLQLILTTDYCDMLLYLFQCQKQLARERVPAQLSPEQRTEAKKEIVEKRKAVLRLLRRLQTDHAEQLRQRTRAMATFCMLKFVLQEKDWFTETDKPDLAKQCEDIHEETLDERLRTLYDLKLIQHRDGKMFLASWHQVCDVFKVPVYERQPMYHVKPTGKKITTVMHQKRLKEKTELCEEVAQAKLNRNPELQYELSKVSGEASHSLSTLADIQLLLYKQPHLIRAFDLDDSLIMLAVRGDTALSYKYWSVLLGYKSIGGFAAHKRALVSDGLITEYSRMDVIDAKLHRGRKSRSNCLGTGIYNPVFKTIKFYRPNVLVFLSVNQEVPVNDKPIFPPGEQWGPYCKTSKRKI